MNIAIGRRGINPVGASRLLLAAIASAAATPAAANALVDTANMSVPLWLPLSLTIALVATALAFTLMHRKLQRTAAESQSAAAELKADNNKLYRQLQSYGSELSTRERQLGETREALELLQQEKSDLQAMVGHRLQRPLEALRSSLSLLARSTSEESAGLVEMAQQQLQATKLTVSQIAEISQEGASSPQAANEAHPTDAPQLSILLIENHSQESVSGTLEMLGHRVTRLNEGEDGIEAAVHGNFQLVMMDCDLRHTDCVEVTRKIRQERGRDLPIFALANNLLPGEKERYQAEGLSGVLPRPVSQANLQQLTSWVSRRTNKQKAKGGKGAPPPRLLNTNTLCRQRDTLGHLPFAELLSSRIAALPKRISALTSSLTGRHWLDAEEQARAAAASADEVGLEAIAARLRELANSLGVDSEREYCRHQRTEVLNLMRASVQQLKAWREQNVHTAWALK